MYPVVTLSRKYSSSSTIGELVLPSGLVLKTLELPWLGNKRNVSCIPEGVYLCKWLERSASGKYRKVWHVQNVANRSGVLIHVGNYLHHTRGCILPGLSSGKDAVWNSTKALRMMRNELGGSDFVLIVCVENK